MASMQEQHQQQVQQQPQQQQQQQQPQPAEKKIYINAETIEMAKNKLKALGPGPYSPEDQKKHDQLKAFLAKAIQLLQNQQAAMMQQQQLQQQQLQQQQQQQAAQHHPPQTQIISGQSHAAHAPTIASVQTVSQVQPASQPQQMQSHPIPQHHPAQQHHAPPAPPPPPQPQPQHQPPPPPSQQQQQQQASQPQSSTNPQIVDKRALQDLVKEVDPSEQLDEDVEELLLQVADDFIENVINNSCQLAKHRKSNVLEAKDVQFHLERNYNIWIPGFGTDELKTHKKALPTEAHKQRLMLIKKSTTGPGAGPGTSQNKDK